MRNIEEIHSNEAENTPHFYYQRSVKLEQELKIAQLKLTKLQDETRRNKEILQNQIEKLINNNQKQEILLLELEQYRQICRAGVAIICRLCGIIVDMSEVMQHLIEDHLFDPIVSKTSNLSSNKFFLKNQLENEKNLENIGSKCFEYIIQDSKEAELLKINISILNKSQLLINIHEYETNSERSLSFTTDQIYRLYLQVILFFNSSNTFNFSVIYFK